ncbi:metallophosphoesterase [Pedobacter rhodius]|uniref:Metallophosphoesterase n=1 Tax=Pedobacter rhodius TaxID=3004098 RepID=A0ABT4KWX4_9SPHI|nr:metallophosphoesterase [Pedobacter sp. SJ11]MCZ4223428.1 metallophosphoesterase [Pedobacter sp. SJ11]
MKRKLSLLPILIITLLFFALNAYVLSGLQTLNGSAYLNPVFWIFIVGLTFALFYAIQQMRIQGMNRFFQIVSHTFLIVFAAETVFAIFLLFGDLYRLVLALNSVFQPEGFHWVARSNYWVDFAFVMFCVTIALFAYGITQGKYAYRVIKHTLYFEDLPENFDGFTLTQISDVHAGSFTNPKAVQKGIDMINAQKSDLFVFTGDLVNNASSEIIPYIGHFSQIKAPFGQFSVLGNHDYGDYVKWPSEPAKAQNLQQLKDYHKKLGFRLLLDEHVELVKGGEKIILAGIENWGIGFGERGDLDKALQNTAAGDFKILLSHDPSHWDARVKNYPSKIQLSLAGHTHGMQFGIEAFGLKWSPVKYRYKHWAGIKTENGRYLNVNRGFGFLGFSGRIGIWPEITVIELKRK